MSLGKRSDSHAEQRTGTTSPKISAQQLPPRQIPNYLLSADNPPCRSQRSAAENLQPCPRAASHHAPAPALFPPMLRPKQRQRQREGKRNLLAKMGARKRPAKKTTASGSCILRLGRHKKVSSSSDTYSEPSLSRRGGEQRKWVRVSPANVSRLRSEQTPGQRGRPSRISPTRLRGSGFQQTSKCFL